LNEGGLRVDSKEAQGLFNKTATAEGVSSNLGHRIWIERFGPNLVRTVRTARRGPDSPIWIGPVRSDKTRPVGGGGRRRLISAARRRSWAISVLRGSKQLELGSRRFSANWGNHLRLRRDAGRAQAAHTTTGAGRSWRRIAGARVLATRASFGL
jgi:hypothetical protein